MGIRPLQECEQLVLVAASTWSVTGIMGITPLGTQATSAGSEPVHEALLELWERWPLQ